jgi:lactoylglutathione lyase
MTTLNHIGFNVKDLKSSLKFYKGLFGFKTADEFKFGKSNIATLDIGGALLELVESPGSVVKPPEGSHLAFYEPDFDKRVAQLEKQGIETRKSAMENGKRLCFFKDPDGHMLELMEKGL